MKDLCTYYEPGIICGEKPDSVRHKCFSKPGAAPNSLCRSPALWCHRFTTKALPNGLVLKENEAGRFFDVEE